MTQDLLTTSVGTLAPAAADRPVFSPLPEGSPEAFDEGPTVLRWKPAGADSVSGSLNNLSSSYPYLQGVEITKQSQYASGLFKIWSGDPQHRLRQTVFGQERVFSRARFVESDRFSALALVRDHATSLSSDNDGPIESYSYNGIIEPLTIRRSVSLSTLANAEPRSVKATVMGGVVDVTGASSEVMSVDVADEPIVTAGFIDGTLKQRLERPTVGLLAPFADVRLVRSVPAVGSEPADMVTALSAMTGSSTDGYVRHDQRSAPCGWYYDNNVRPGTDSLAFGGMTH